MNYGLLGEKKEMTQLFDEGGNLIPVTIVDLSKTYIVGDYGKDAKKILVGIGRKRNPNKADLGRYKGLSFVPKHTKEVSIYGEVEQKVGENVDPVFEEGEKVVVSGKTKGKGFQGVVRRWGFAGGPKTHGQSDRHRAPGSIGGGTTPGRVYKGKKMPGRMGGKITTVSGLKIVKYDSEKGLLAIKGAIPGYRGSVVYISKE